MTPVTPPAPLGRLAAVALVFGSSAAVLVVELVALRLLAPYLGLTLETSTLVIGIALTAIALGSWSGGRAADAMDARRLLAPLLAVSGAAVALTPSLVRAVAEKSPEWLEVVAASTILVPGVLLSAITPMVTKLRLTSLDETGSVVGRLSGISTMGAIAGTILTGFVLVSRLPVSGILLGLGALLVVASALTALQTRAWRAASCSAAVVAAASLVLTVVPGGCDVETRYHCAQVVNDPGPGNGRTLVLDGLRHSFVDLEDPTRLEFTYVRAIAAVTDAAFAADAPLAAYHLGGGGLTLPRWLSVVRPGSRSVVSEIDPGVVQIDRDRLGLDRTTGIEVRVEDGRRGLSRLGTDTRDLVVGDAFGGVSVPWHLTTVESAREVRRVLRPDGLYVANLIDYGPLRFARAEVATLRAVFDEVAVLGEAADVTPGLTPNGGNLVVVASDRAVELDSLRQALDSRSTGWAVFAGAALDSWVGRARVLTDDRAPVDQLLTLPPGGFARSG